MAGSLLLVGCGKMGSAMLAGWLAAAIVDRVVVVDPSGAPGAPQHPAVSVVPAIDAVPAGFAADVVVLAVKPQVMDGVLAGCAGLVHPGTVFLSVAAGKTIASFARHLGDGAAVVRAMPNTPAAIGRGMTVAVANPLVPEERRNFCDALLRAVGQVAWIEDEALMDAVTAVSGSGPAYVFLLAEVLAAAGREAGLPADLAVQLARATVAGAGELLHRSDTPAGQLREAVTSPGGTTQAALSVLMAGDGMQPLLTAAVAAAARRSRELAG
ncbi:pyrroline-5-carboxylate reductase [Azospirillum fermentarium]|uniref:pyrroline-5-carboxylate reductase n=1 Tax=Azospirillum fermentarium TaxID=1233114 RepID=UPI0022268886|nr:pyrroline-5-carboxylate reductase [Azospirillum fermentarium]MCW2247222.1 pyrroline-5-carboxylate reductase [Azospirillum fermentarium]